MGAPTRAQQTVNLDFTVVVSVTLRLWAWILLIVVYDTTALSVWVPAFRLVSDRLSETGTWCAVMLAV